NRSAAEVRHAFTKNGGNLGENGCVAFMFERKGLLMIDKNVEADEEEIMLQAIEAGADEVESEENGMIIYTEPDHLESVKEALEAEGIQFVTSEVTMIPQTTTTPSEDDAMKMQKLIDMLEDYDDVQGVYHNMD